MEIKLQSLRYVADNPAFILLYPFNDPKIAHGAVAEYL